MASNSEFKDLPFFRMSNANLIHCGEVRYEKMTGTMLNTWMAKNCKGNETIPVRELTDNPSILIFIDIHKFAIAFANGKEPDESYEPTVYEMCVFWGYLSYERGSGIFDQEKMPVAESDYYDKSGTLEYWGQVVDTNKTGIFAPAQVGGRATLDMQNTEPRRLPTLKAGRCWESVHFQCPHLNYIKKWNKMDNDSIRCQVCRNNEGDALRHSGYMLKEDYDALLKDAEWVRCVPCRKNGKDCRKIMTAGDKGRCRHSGNYEGCGQRNRFNLEKWWERVGVPMRAFGNC